MDNLPQELRRMANTFLGDCPDRAKLRLAADEIDGLRKAMKNATTELESCCRSGRLPDCDKVIQILKAAIKPEGE